MKLVSRTETNALSRTCPLFAMILSQASLPVLQASSGGSDLTRSFDLQNSSKDWEKSSRSDGSSAAVVGGLVALAGAGLTGLVLTGNRNPSLPLVDAVGAGVVMLGLGLFLFWTGAYVLLNPGWVRIEVSNDNLTFVSKRANKTKSLPWTSESFYLRLEKAYRTNLMDGSTTIAYFDDTDWWAGERELTEASVHAILHGARSKGLSVSTKQKWSGALEVTEIRPSQGGKLLVSGAP